MARQRKRKRPAVARGGSNPAPLRPDPAQTALAARIDLFVAALFGLLTILAVAGYPEGKRWIFIAAAASLALIDGIRRVYQARELTVDLGDAILAGLIGFGALSLLWTANRNGGIQTIIIASAMLVLVIYLKRFANDVISMGVVIGAGLAALMALLTNAWLPREQFSGFANSGYAAEAFVLTIPLLWPLWRNGKLLARGFAVLVIVASLFFVLVYTPSMIEAFVIAIFAAIVSLFYCFRRNRALGWLCVAVWLILPPLVAWVGWDQLKLTSRLLIRAELWLNAAFMVADRPLFGHGLGSFIEIFPLYKEAHGDLMPFVNTTFESYVTEAEAIHNEPVQLLTELGLVGLLPFLTLVALTLRAGVRRLASDPFAAAGAAAVVTVMGESLLEYPFQRAATLFLATIAFAFAARGAESGLRQWRFRVPTAVPLAVAPVALAAVALLLFASYRQNLAESLVDASRIPGLDPSQAFSVLYNAHKLDPLERRIRTALPVMLDGMIRSRGFAAVDPKVIDQVYAWAEDGGTNNTAALVAHAQLLIERDNGDDPDFPRVLALLKRGSTRVAAVYAIEARYQILHNRLAEALATIAEGKKYTEGVSAIPGADAAIKANLDNLERVARARMLAQQIQQQAPSKLQLSPQAQPRPQP